MGEHAFISLTQREVSFVIAVGVLSKSASMLCRMAWKATMLSSEHGPSVLFLARVMDSAFAQYMEVCICAQVADCRHCSPPISIFNLDLISIFNLDF